MKVFTNCVPMYSTYIITYYKFHLQFSHIKCRAVVVKETQSAGKVPDETKRGNATSSQGSARKFCKVTFISIAVKEKMRYVWEFSVFVRRNRPYFLVLEAVLDALFWEKALYGRAAGWMTQMLSCSWLAEASKRLKSSLLTLDSRVSFARLQGPFVDVVHVFLYNLR